MIIVSPEKINIPSIERLASLRKAVFSSEKISGTTQSPGEAGRSGSIIGGKSGSAKEREIRRGRPSEKPVATLPPELISGFRLEAPQAGKTEFTLNINPDESETAGTKREMTMDELDLLSYVRSISSRIRPLHGNPIRKIRTGVSSRDPKTAGDAVEYNITPWAEIVVARIQKNWSIPPIQVKDEKKAVEISMVIAKSGGLLSFKIRNSSGLPHLDEAALIAVRLSAPLPALPDDYPLNRLETDLLFQYYE